MSVQGAAQILGVHANTIRNWINTGRLASVSMGAQKLPVAAEVLKLVPDQPEMDTDVVAAQLEAFAESFENRAKVLREMVAKLREGEEL